jgi:hypothetical protein
MGITVPRSTSRGAAASHSFGRASTTNRFTARALLAGVASLTVAAVLVVSIAATAPQRQRSPKVTQFVHARGARPLVARPRTRRPLDKAPKMLPSRRLLQADSTTNTNSTAPSLPLRQSSLATAALADPTPPIAPTTVSAQTQSILAISAQWDAGQDPESGISYYIFGVGTNSSGNYNTLANVRYWQVTYSTDMSVSLALDPKVSYYVSVFAVNGSGVSSTIVTSNPIRPVWQDLGQASNVMQIQFATSGYDASGNPTTGWTPEQTALIGAFFNRMYPILVQNYGPPADNYTVTLVRDLRYHNSNIFMPSLHEIHMDDGFYPQLFTHELVHAFRNNHLLSSDQNWNYDPTLSGFEESFAQAVSYDAMNSYVAAYPNDTIVAGNTLWGSSSDWDYDFQNTGELRGTDFWSDGGATGLYWLRYEMGAAAMRKIEIESPGFFKAFNREYYRRINADPTAVRPTRPMIVDIIKALVPTIEAQPADTWLNHQNIFYAQNVYGEKIFHRIQDYPAGDFFAFQSLYFLDTMPCGSEWACWDGTKWVYYRLNGSQGNARLVDDAGTTIWSGPLSIQPAQNPSDGYYAVGSATAGLTTASSLQPWPGGNTNDWVMNLTSFGLYRFDSTFVDPQTQAATSNSIYRVLGSPLTNNFGGVYGGIVGHDNGTIYLDHEGYPAEPGIPVAHGAFAATRAWTGIPNTRTGGHDSVPGRVFMTFVDSDTGITYHAQRNIDYGSATGSQMFLFDSTDLIGPAPSVAIVAPANGAMVTGIVAISATASSSAGIANVAFYLDNTVLMGSSTTAPYGVAWDTTTLAQASGHTITARTTALDGQTATSSPVSVTIRDTAAPNVAITTPASAAKAAGTVTIGATATDNIGVTRVSFYADGKLIATDTAAPYAVSWNAETVALGSHTLTAQANDQAGNSGSATPVTVTVVDVSTPTVTINAPNNGATVPRNATLTIAATASDNRGVARLEFYVNNTLKCRDTTIPYSCAWAVPAARGARYTIRVRGYDSANNFSDVSISVTSST